MPSASRNLRSSHAVSGFTLVELLVVIGCMALLLGVAIPGFASVNKARQFTNSLQSIELALDQARTHAMARSTYTWVTLDAPGGKLKLTVEESLAGTSARTPSAIAPLGTALDLEMAPVTGVSQSDVPREQADSQLNFPARIVFSPEGTARSEAAATLPRRMEFAVAASGTDKRDVAVVQVTGIAGQVSIKRK